MNTIETALRSYRYLLNHKHPEEAKQLACCDAALAELTALKSHSSDPAKYLREHFDEEVRLYLVKVRSSALSWDAHESEVNALLLKFVAQLVKSPSSEAGEVAAKTPLDADRAKFLADHGAPSTWAIITEWEVAVMKEHSDMLRGQRDEARAALSKQTEEVEAAIKFSKYHGELLSREQECREQLKDLRVQCEAEQGEVQRLSSLNRELQEENGRLREALALARAEHATFKEVHWPRLAGLVAKDGDCRPDAIVYPACLSAIEQIARIAPQPHGTGEGE